MSRKNQNHRACYGWGKNERPRASYEGEGDVKKKNAANMSRMDQIHRASYRGRGEGKMKNFSNWQFSNNLRWN